MIKYTKKIFEKGIIDYYKNNKLHRYLDLTGPDGNAYYLLGYAKSLGEQIGLSEEEISKVLNDMRSSDYEHLIKVFDDQFNKLVTLYQ